MLLRTAIAEGVEYVDLEEDIAGRIPRFGKTKRIVSLHDFRKTPDDLEDDPPRLGGLDADIVKIATMANARRQPADAADGPQSKVPTVGLCMGDIGMPTRILWPASSAHRSPTPHFQHERTLAPGQLSFEQMRDVYHYDQIDARDRSLRRDRRSGRPQPQPAGPQRGLPRA